MNQVFIGYDARERLAWNICAASLQSRASIPLTVAPISRPMLEQAGLYSRPHRDAHWDDISNAPCSTDFSLARFWTPRLAGASGWALFVDGDFLFRRDVHELFSLADPSKAVMLVPHQYAPEETIKMDGQQQTVYPRKNWSSLVLWNLAHMGARRLDYQRLNTMTGRDLHGFAWLDDSEIGFLPEEWNWLDGHSSRELDPAAVHFTRGTPDMPGWEWTRYAHEWHQYAQGFKGLIK